MTTASTHRETHSTRLHKVMLMQGEGDHIDLEVLSERYLNDLRKGRISGPKMPPIKAEVRIR